MKSPQRFLKEKISNTGQDPRGSIIEFVKKDLIKPLDRKILEKDDNKNNDKLPLINNKWAANAPKICSTPEKLAKIHQFKEYSFIKKDPIVADLLKKNYIKTDNISIKVQNDNDSNKKIGNSFLESKGIFWIIKIDNYFLKFLHIKR